MIHGRKASGYTVEGGKVTGETHQCAHCQYVWVAKPGSGTRRGFCIDCNSLTCGRQECALDQKQKLEQFGLTRKNCIPFDEYNYRLSEIAGKAEQSFGKLGEGFQMTESGIVIPITA